jgi:hypothetical protein
MKNNYENQKATDGQLNEFLSHVISKLGYNVNERIYEDDSVSVSSVIPFGALEDENSYMDLILKIDTSDNANKFSSVLHYGSSRAVIVDNVAVRGFSHRDVNDLSGKVELYLEDKFDQLKTADQRNMDKQNDLISVISEMPDEEIEKMCKNHKTDATVLEVIAGMNCDYSHRYHRALCIVANPNAPKNLVNDLVLENIGMGIPDSKAKPFITAVLKNDKTSSDIIDLITERCVRPVGAESSYFEDEMYIISGLPQTSNEALEKLAEITKRETYVNIILHPNVSKETLLNSFERFPGHTVEILENPIFDKIKTDFTTSPKNILKLAGKEDKLKFFAGKKIEVKTTENTIILHKGKKIVSAVIELTSDGIKAEYNINKPKMQTKATPQNKHKTPARKKGNKIGI